MGRSYGANEPPAPAAIIFAPSATPRRRVFHGSHTMTAIDDDFLRAVSDRASRSGAFDRVEMKESRLVCAARGAAAEAWYRIEPREGAWHVLLVTPDRWLSESIESDLMHTGDSLEELLDEELAELGVDASVPAVHHYRSDERMYTFAVRLPDGGNVDLVSTYLLAFEATFRRLGDMAGDEGE